jgi:hypothetical protein
MDEQRPSIPNTRQRERKSCSNSGMELLTGSTRQPHIRNEAADHLPNIDSTSTPK